MMTLMDTKDSIHKDPGVASRPVFGMLPTHCGLAERIRSNLLAVHLTLSEVSQATACAGR
jgi:hypothetical protein